MKIRLTKLMVIVFFSLLASCCVFEARTEEVISSEMHTIRSEAMPSDEEIAEGSLSKKRIVL